MKKQAIETVSSAEPAGFTLSELTFTLAITAMVSGCVAVFVRLAVGR